MMNKRDILIGIGILGFFAIGAVLFLLVIPNYKPGEDAFPTLQPTVQAQVSTSPTVASTATSSVAANTAAATATIKSPTATTVAVTATPLQSPTATAVPQPTRASGIPQVTQRPYNLPKGIGPSDGARSCPQPLPVEKIRADYLAYWEAFVKAYREGNPDTLKPFVDIEAADGKIWQSRQQAIQKTVQGGYYLDYQIEHTNPLIIEINPTFGGPGQCQVSVFDGVKLSSLAKKKSSDELFDKTKDKPYVQQYQPTHSFEMVVRNGRWLIAGEGAGGL